MDAGEPIALPRPSARPFASPGPSIAGLLARARGLHQRLAALGAGPVCLASEDKVLAAAALLAALGGGPRLVLPHATSPAVLDEARQATGYTAALAAPAQPLPDAVERLDPATVPAAPATGWSPELRAADAPFVQLFTGGSSGRPQVWSKTPANLFGEARVLAQRFAIGADDVFLASVPPLHIYGLLFSVVLPLVSGARVVAAGPVLPAEIAAALERERPTVFVSGPAHYRALRRSALRAPGLRLAFSSGGMLDAADGARFTERTGVGVSEVYGSTETGGIAVRQRAAGETEWSPLAGVRWALAGDRLAVDSPHLSPELDRDPAGRYVTGDRVAPGSGDRFVLLGRADGIVKVGGKRVDLLEIEQKLRAVPGVEDAHVLAREQPGRLAEIVALVVGARDEAALRRALAARLPPAAMPRRLLRLDAIPTTAAGKRDARAIDRILDAE
jgi:acyl-coenzyme A synthetase/AMP-(fatty) acid ligase